MVSRSEILLRSVGRNATIIEIGPSYNPVAPKAAGWNAKSIDIGTRAGLIEKYQSANVNTDLIQDVDFIWRGCPISDDVPSSHHGSFDVLIASHVIEHTPDMVTFLNSAATL